MISVEEAKAIVLQNVKVNKPQFLSLAQAGGRVLADDVIALHEHPLFDMSAVDGYALGDATGPWKVVARMAAGEVLGRSLTLGECVRIFTGAQVPAGSHAVVMQEQCAEMDGTLTINGAVPPQGANIRRKGEGVKANAVLARKGTRLNAATVGQLASCGVAEITVATAPALSIVRTGGEFIEGSAPQPGRIFSSNERILTAAIEQFGYSTVADAFIATDNEAEIRNALLNACERGDVVISTGGVSVGDHDLMRAVLKELGATIHFHGVAQKPGKPMLFATLNSIPVFALPGNPRAVMMCFWEYVLPFLDATCGAASPGLRSDHCPIAHAVTVKGERAEFRAARVRGGKVELLANEGSHLLGSLAEADAIAYFPRDVRTLHEGNAVEVHHLPNR